MSASGSAQERLTRLEGIRARLGYLPYDGDTWAVSTGEVEGDVRVCRVVDGRCVCCIALMGTTDELAHWTPDTFDRWEAEGEFIAAARADIPWLLRDIAVLERRVADLTDERAAVRRFFQDMVG